MQLDAAPWLWRISQTQRQLAGLQDLLVLQVAQAREQGASWVDVGQALGVTRQAARKRFSEGNRSEAEGGSHD